MGWNPVKEAEKKAKQAIDKVLKPAVKKIVDETVSEKGPIWKLRRETWARITKLGDNVVSKIKSAGETAEEKAIGNIKKAGEEIEKDLAGKLPKEIEKAVQSAFNELRKAVTKEGLKKVREVVRVADRDLTKLANSKPGLVDQIDNLGFSLELGPVTLDYSNFYTRISNIADVLDTYVNHPPELRRDPIIKMIVALGPDSVDLGASVQVVAVVVGSKEFGVGGKLNSFGIELFAEIGDALLEKLGVPE